MKKLIFLPAIVCMAIMGSINIAHAQSMKPRLGIKAGANLMTLGKYEAAGTTFDYDHRFGFQGGLFADLPLASNLTFMPQVLYSQKGGTVKATVGATTGEIKSRVNYLDVPLSVGIKPTPDITIFFGPQVSFLLSQTSDTYVNGAATTTSTDTKDLRKSMIGGNVGIGFNLNSNVTLNANYTMDFQSVGNDNINQGKTKNSGFGLGLGYSF
jgi:outer membrane immunogenic protein